MARVAPTHLLHLAWNAKPGYWTSRDNFAWAAASLRLLERFEALGGKRAVIAGACAEYDWSAAQIFNERTSPTALCSRETASPYSICKATLEAQSASCALATGLSLAWGRVFFQYGLTRW